MYGFYMSIGAIVKQVRMELMSMESCVREVSNKLLEMEEVRKDNQGLIKKKIVEHRKRLVREFERAVSEMEEEIIQKMIREDEEFIEKLEGIDDRLMLLEKKIQREKIEL
jgi:VIT1/CCC1 family predicted Fe2+/Mn2+ transporter